MYAERLTEDDVVVVLLPDSGRGYLSKIFNDDWMADYGFLTPATAESTVSVTCWTRKGEQLPDLVHVHPHETVGQAIDVAARVRRLADAGGQGGAAGDGRRDRRLGRRAGPAGRRCSPGRAQLDDPLEQHKSAPLPQVGSGEPISALMSVLEKADAAVVLVEGKPRTVLSRQDLLAYLAAAGTGTTTGKAVGTGRG